MPEFQNEDYGIGLYIDKSKTLQDIAIKESTVFETSQYILLDSDADEYYKFCEKFPVILQIHERILFVNVDRQIHRKISIAIYPILGYLLQRSHQFSFQ